MGVKGRNAAAQAGVQTGLPGYGYARAKPEDSHPQQQVQ
mgnify:CR=1 FL=1|jgi:hypothetical protein